MAEKRNRFESQRKEESKRRGGGEQRAREAGRQASRFLLGSVLLPVRKKCNISRKGFQVLQGR